MRLKILCEISECKEIKFSSLNTKIRIFAMGFFSYKCRECNLSLLNGTSVGGNVRVLSEVVAVGYNGIMYRGMYDGYGSVNGEDLLQDARDGLFSFNEFTTDCIV